ncbi:MAG TPA: hypothetical protein VG710_18070 [Opitutus sp.]|nr:hypothetical protein [Opitutus sp.]
MPLAVFLGPLASLHAQPLPGESPFTAPLAAAPESKPADSGFVLLGMSVVGQTTLLGISRTSDRHSFWIPLGGTTSDITAVSYNAKLEQAVIRVSGKNLTLDLRHAAVAPAAPTASAPAAPVPSATAMTAQQEKEMEARMLVSDLLEIGQQQRKAYAAAAEKAAAEKQAAAQKAATEKSSAAKPNP